MYLEKSLPDIYIFTNQFIDEIAARVTGPMNFRFIVQPLAAICLGARDGLLDARAGTPPFVYDLIFTAENRWANLQAATRRLLVPVTIGIFLDVLAQDLLFGVVREGGALLVGVTLLGVPYSLARGVANRIASRRSRKAAA